MKRSRLVSTKKIQKSYYAIFQAMKKKGLSNFRQTLWAWWINILPVSSIANAKFANTFSFAIMLLSHFCLTEDCLEFFNWKNNESFVQMMMFNCIDIVFNHSYSILTYSGFSGSCISGWKSWNLFNENYTNSIVNLKDSVMYIFWYKWFVWVSFL